MLRFDVENFLGNLRAKTKVIKVRKDSNVFVQGEPASAVFYYSKWTGETHGHFRAGEGGSYCGSEWWQFLRRRMCCGPTPSHGDRRGHHRLYPTLHWEARNIRYEAELVDQLFNSSEKRLARILLLLARYGREGPAVRVIPRISHETLAQMVGTTRPHINRFMNKFRKLGYIDYDGGLEVHNSLLQLTLHD